MNSFDVSQLSRWSNEMNAVNYDVLILKKHHVSKTYIGYLNVSEIE